MDSLFLKLFCEGFCVRCVYMMSDGGVEVCLITRGRCMAVKRASSRLISSHLTMY